MPIGTYTMLKGTKPAFEEKSSANYYAYGPSGSVATYKKISGLITLPDKVRLVGTGKGRNAFISLGVTAKGGKRGIDIGLRNRGLGCQNEELDINIPSKDTGYGWHPYCIELDKTIDAGYYFDGQKNIHKTDQVSRNDAYFAPNNAKQARFEIVPNTNGRSVHFTVTWLDANGTQVGTVFDRVIDLEGTLSVGQLLPLCLLGDPGENGHHDRQHLRGKRWVCDPEDRQRQLGYHHVPGPPGLDHERTQVQAEQQVGGGGVVHHRPLGISQQRCH